MNATEIFAERLRQLRLRRSESLHTTAEAVGVTAQSLSLYEKGQRTINIDLLKRLAEYFGVSADYLIGLSDTAALDTDMKAVCEYTGLNEKTVSKIKSIESEFSFKHKYSHLNGFVKSEIDGNIMNYHFDVSPLQILNDFICSEEYIALMYNLYIAATCQSYDFSESEDNNLIETHNQCVQLISQGIFTVSAEEYSHITLNEFQQLVYSLVEKLSKSSVYKFNPSVYLEENLVKEVPDNGEHKTEEE